MDDPQGALHQLRFYLGVSRRYHQSRRAFYERIDKLSKLSSLFLALGISGTILNVYPTLSLIATAISSTIMVFDVVVSAGKSAKQHHDLARAFIDLQISAHKLENSEEEFSHSAVAEIGCKRLVIEKEEEPQLEILTAKCYNDEIRARGYTDNFRIPLNPIQILFMQYIDLGSAKLPQVYQKTEAIAPPSPSNLLSSQSPEDVEDKI